MATPEGILELFIGDASKVVDANLTAALEAHVKALSGAGYSGVKVLDEALLFLLHRGESHAMMREAGLGDSLGIRPVIMDYADYPKRLRRDWKPAAYNLINRRRNIQLMVTRECNLRCAYCAVKKEDRAMSDKVMYRSVDFLLSSAQENLRLDFTGGEPLYYFDTIEKACHYGRAKAQGAGKKLTFYMITNGTLLDEDIARRLAELPIMLEISLDGTENLHNKFKIPQDKSLNPYAETRRAIELMLEQGLDFYVVMVATPETAGQLQENFEHIHSLGVRHLDINYAIGSLWNRQAMETYLAQVTSILKQYSGDIKTDRLKLGNIRSRVEPSILNPEWMVDTDGSVHLMTEWVFQSTMDAGPGRFSFGNVKEGLNFNSIYADRFHAYQTLLQSAGWKMAHLRKIIHNNVEVGRRVGKFFGNIAGRSTMP